jgi:hypothetical protein
MAIKKKVSDKLAMAKKEVMKAKSPLKMKDSKSPAKMSYKSPAKMKKC